jgi:monoamine oxidase
MKPSLVSTIARQVGAVPDGPTRRQFLKTTLAAGAALMLGGRPVAGRAARPRVLVIGAGFGGLSCGYQLQQAGADVRILEARNRIGGRVLSLDKFIPGRVVEGGAELIGSNHPTWVAYAKLFGLELREMTSPHDDESPILLGGKRYSGTELEKLWEGLDRTLRLMNADARQVNLEQPWASAQAAEWDATSLSQAAARWDVGDRLRHAALNVLANDGATWPERASYLACLSTIAGGGFEVFWTESEIYRCVGGNQSLAFKLAESIGSDRIDLNTPVTLIQCSGAGVTVHTASGQRHEADLAVLTAPPSTWDHFQVEPGLPPAYRPTTGPAIKYLAKVDRPFWTDSGLHPDSLTDTPIGCTWEGTDAQPQDGKDPACLTVFSGGQAAQDCLDVPAEARKAFFEKQIGAIYPGFGRHFEEGMFMGWPSEKWTRCGYTAPSTGEVTSVYPLLAQGFEDRLFFAGEYSSLLFTGYMEGGLHSGAVLAKRLAGKLNL